MMKAKAYAKVNLNLIVTSKRKDGKHNLESVFHKIDLFDDIEIIVNNTDKCVIKSNKKELEKENLIYKAFDHIKTEYPQVGGVDVNLVKRIPMQAGLGGGSSDCSTFIKMINELFNLKMSKKKMHDIAFELGADVVPCLYDYPVKATGVGHLVKKIDSKLEFYLVLVKPSINCHTGEMFNKLDSIKIKNKCMLKQTTRNIIKSLENNDLVLLSNNLYNSFEEVVDEGILDIKKELIETGAINSLLTGSGSCVFGIFVNEKDALKCFEKLKNKYETYICKSINNDS